LFKTVSHRFWNSCAVRVDNGFVIRKAAVFIDSETMKCRVASKNPVIRNDLRLIGVSNKVGDPFFNDKPQAVFLDKNDSAR